jgi:hypothetical protein
MTEMTLANVTSGRVLRPLRINIYGTDGVGKTTFGANAPSPIFISTEDGSHHVDVARFPVPTTWHELLQAVGVLITEPHEFKTLCIDSMDWAEALCDKHLVERYNADHNNTPVIAVTDIPFGRWKALKMKEFTHLLDGLSVLVRDCDMHIVLISHANIVRFEDPEREAYERYSIALQLPALRQKVSEWADFNLFANFDTVVRPTGEGFNKRGIGTSHGKRLLFSRRRAAFDAKARFNIPERMELSWDIFWAEYQKAINEPQGAIHAGV